MHKFVINLKKDTDKKQYISEHFPQHGINDFSFVEGVDGKNLSEEQLHKLYHSDKTKKEWNRDLTFGEIGCALSHLNCYQKIVRENLDGAFIFEDDCKLGSQAAAIIRAIEKNTHMLPEKCWIHLGYVRYIFNKKVLLQFDNDYSLKYGYKGDGAYAYFISYAAAKNMLKEFELISKPNDALFQLKKKGIFSLLCIDPYCISIMDDAYLQSNIEQNRGKAIGKRNLTSHIWKVIRESIRPFLRKIAYGITGIKYVDKNW